MAYIEDRSRTQISVKGQYKLTKFFSYDKTEDAQQYHDALHQRGLAAVATVLDEAYLVRYYVNGKRKSVTASSQREALSIKTKIEFEEQRGSPVDPMAARKLSCADLLIRYVREEAPRKKSFLVIGYQVNKWLEDAGLERLDIAAIHAAHTHPQNRALRIPKAGGRRMSLPCDATAFIRKSFASILPEHFAEYIDERLESGASPATVDRELDVFRTVCSAAMKKWRIPLDKSPMDGVERPPYFNERDRRLRGDEEERLFAAAREEDRRLSARALADELSEENDTQTKYQRLKNLEEARNALQDDSLCVPLLDTFIEFALMTAARRTEMLKLRWTDIRLEEQTAYFAETKNGRPRTVPLRSDLVELLHELPRVSEFVFPITGDYLRKAWKRICQAAGIPTEGDDRLRIHDLRHEAISRVAEAGSRTPGGFSLLDLQAFSGHRDPRMLMRYAHLSPTGLAKRLDAAFAGEANTRDHHGRRRLTRKAKMPMSDIMVTPMVIEPDVEPEPVPAVAANDKVVRPNVYRRIAA